MSVIPTSQRGPLPLGAERTSRPVQVAKVFGEFDRAMAGMAEIVGTNLVALPELIGNVVEQRSEGAVLPHILGQVIANVFVGLGIVDARLADPKIEIVPVQLDLIQQPPPERLILVVDGKHFPHHLLDIKIEVVVEDGVPVAITVGDGPVYPSLPQEVVEAVRVVGPTD